MKLKSRIVVAVCLAAVLGSESLFAQISAPLPVSTAQGETQQFAYNIFSTWANNSMTEEKKGKIVAESILFGGAGLCLAGAGTVWLAGDTISRNATGYPMDAEGKSTALMALGITGGSLLFSGAIVALVPVKDYRVIYADIFAESDASVREAMAAAVLKNMADDGKRDRINSTIFWYAMPVIQIGASMIVNAVNGENPAKGIASNASSLGFGVLFGTLNLLKKSDSELRYERYLSVRDSYYAKN